MSIQFQARYLLEDEGLRILLDEMSSVGGGVAAGGAEFASGTGMEYTTKDDLEEDAPTLAAGEADIHTLTQDGFTNSPSLSAAGRLPSMFAGTLSAIPSECPSRYRGGSVRPPRAISSDPIPPPIALPYCFNEYKVATLRKHILRPIS